MYTIKMSFWWKSTVLTADFKLADDNGFVQYKGQFYASLDKLSKLLDMTCSFDTATNTLTMTDKSEGVSTVPTKYDLRKDSVCH